MVPVSKQLSLFFSCFRAKHSGPVYSILIKDPCSISQNRIDVILRITKPCLRSFDVLSYNTLRSGFRSGGFFQTKENNF